VGLVLGLPPARWLGWTGLGEAIYMLMQNAGLDPLWWPLTGVVRLHDAQPLSTLGAVNVSAAWIAITAPLWAAGAMAAVLLWTHSLGALMAMLAALAAMRWRGIRTRGLTVWIVAGLLAPPLFWTPRDGLYDAFVRGTFVERLMTWQLGLADWTATWPSLLFGWGPSARAPRINAQLVGRTETWPYAMNEYLQWAHAAGLLGLLVLGLTLWHRSRLFRSPSVIALAVIAASSFPFRHPMLALLSITVIMRATKET
jgi:hypothetical protein